MRFGEAITPLTRAFRAHACSERQGDVGRTDGSLKQPQARRERALSEWAREVLLARGAALER